MTTLSEAAQQALTILDAWKHKCMWGDWDGVTDTLRAALAEPVQEPVAWIQPDHLQKARRAPFLCRVEPTKRMVDFVALYTAPPQRKPLSDEDIEKAYRHIYRNLPYEFDHSTPSWVEQGIRYAERAHGIGGSDE